MKVSRITDWLTGGLVGGLTSLPLIAISYLASKLAGLPFFPFDLFDWLARILPGNLVNLGIESMVRVITFLGLGPLSSAAKTFEQSMGIVLVIAACAALGAVLAMVGGVTRRPGAAMGAIAGLLAGLIVAAIELGLNNGARAQSLLWPALLFIGWGALVGTWLMPKQPAAASAANEDLSSSRRELLFKIAGGSIALAVAATGLGKLLEQQEAASAAGKPLSTLGTSVSPTAISSAESTPTPQATLSPGAKPTLVATARDRVPAAPGTRAELTANKDFYRIDIDTLPQMIDKNSWKLQVRGLFDHPRDLTLSELAAMPSVTQPITQSCISNPVAGDLIGTIQYTGVPLRQLLSDMGMRPEATALSIKAADGFYETVGMRDLMDPRTLLVYGMNGDTLPVEHGFPLRIYIPNRYGMKQPKWITSIEAVSQAGSGYWVDRGWSPTAFPLIVSVIDTIAKDHIENGLVPIGGIAWAGDRGIQKVEVQVDGREWGQAVLRTPPLGPLTWVQWRYDWPLVRGAHTFRVRATDGTGTLQTEAAHDTFPDGATGYHTVSTTI